VPSVEATTAKIPITSYKPKSRKAAAYKQFAREVIKQCQNKSAHRVQKPVMKRQAMVSSGKKLGIIETRRKQYLALRNLPEFLQQQIISLGNKPSQNQLTEKHAGALLLLKNNPEAQEKLY
jgi:DNA polymerase elongation subunit (family B)